MSVCKCNTGCANQRCIFRKNKLVCTGMCQCSDCKTEDNDFDAEWESDVDNNGGDVEYFRSSNFREQKLSRILPKFVKV